MVEHNHNDSGDGLGVKFIIRKVSDMRKYLRIMFLPFGSWISLPLGPGVP